MQYMVLLYINNEAFASATEEQLLATRAEYDVVSQTPGIRGGDQLQPASTSTTVRVQDGRTLTTDGPFVETKEELGGYYLFEADDLDAAIEFAARIPAARMGGAVEIRPVMER